MDTKLKGDIAEQAAILHALKREWGVLKPVGDRLPYDLVFDVTGYLTKIQIKSAWFDQPSGNYVVDNRRTKTNRRVMLRETYDLLDFDFALAYIEPLDLFYVFPVEIFITYGSEIHLVETNKRQRKPRSTQYRNAWELIQEKAGKKNGGLYTPDELSDSMEDGKTPRTRVGLTVLPPEGQNQQSALS